VKSNPKVNLGDHMKKIYALFALLSLTIITQAFVVRNESFETIFVHDVTFHSEKEIYMYPKKIESGKEDTFHDKDKTRHFIDLPDDNETTRKVNQTMLDNVFKKSNSEQHGRLLHMLKRLGLDASHLSLGLTNY